MNQPYQLLMNIRQHLPLRGLVVLLGFAVLLGASGVAPAVIMQNVKATKHNLSVSGPGSVKATSETQICAAQ